ncbi:MAG: hypothetical protein E6L00_01720 [Thaumarchaeota archaeon]|nr:MAG: hypothetical protein E6L02_05720 [Nitrososphaerota archaeon]TLX83187.1 MAG: hypothetical protein E6L00_01720 [Nitrososphaerota archaeon]
MVANKIEAEPADNTKLNKKDKNYLIENCAVCHQELKLVAGAIIFGDKWYHKDCYDSIPERVNRNLIEDF